MAAVISGDSLENLTAKSVRRGLESRLGLARGSLHDRRHEVRALIDEVLGEMRAEEAEAGEEAEEEVLGWGHEGAEPEDGGTAGSAQAASAGASSGFKHGKWSKPEIDACDRALSALLQTSYGLDARSAEFRAFLHPD